MSDPTPPPAKAPPARPPAARPGADPALAALEAQSQVSEILSLAAGALFGAAVATALAATFVFDQPMPDDVTKIVWYGIRTAGVVAYILLWLTVISGLAISGVHLAVDMERGAVVGADSRDPSASRRRG